MHLLIDNFDSFTYNIVQTIGELGAEAAVYRNNAITVAEAVALAPTSLIISPGPGTPDDSGISRGLIREFTGKIPIFGVCLGHQCIVDVNGGIIERAERPMHGKVSQVYHDNKTIYDGISNPFKATRYHSLITTETTLPDSLMVTAYTSRGEIMGVRMKDQPVEGVQFHPESILTPEGKQLLENFLAITRGNGR